MRTWTMPRRFGRSARLAVLFIVTALTGTVHATKDTPFGTELVAANFPNSSAQDFVNALSVSAAVGSHSCFTWHWGDANSPLSAVVGLPPLMRQFGLKSFIQFAATFLGNPAAPPGFGNSFSDPALRARYLADVTAIAKTQPDYMVLTTEANIMHRFNRTEFEHFRSLYAEAYKAVKSVSPNTKVGNSFLYSLWFYDFLLTGVDVPALLGPSDFIAFTTYPEWLISEGHYPDIASIPPEFHGFAREAYPNARLIFSEVGWSSKGRGTPELQAEFVRSLPRLFSTVHPELVTWALLHDVEFFQPSLLTAEQTQFLVSLGVDINILFEHFNGMGLLRGDGTSKPALQDALNLQFNAP